MAVLQCASLFAKPSCIMRDSHCCIFLLYFEITVGVSAPSDERFRAVAFCKLRNGMLASILRLCKLEEPRRIPEQQCNLQCSILCFGLWQSCRLVETPGHLARAGSNRCVSETRRGSCKIAAFAQQSSCRTQSEAACVCMTIPGCYRNIFEGHAIKVEAHNRGIVSWMARLKF